MVAGRVPWVIAVDEEGVVVSEGHGSTVSEVAGEDPEGWRPSSRGVEPTRPRRCARSSFARFGSEKCLCHQEGDSARGWSQPGRKDAVTPDEPVAANLSRRMYP